MVHGHYYSGTWVIHGTSADNCMQYILKPSLRRGPSANILYIACDRWRTRSFEPHWANIIANIAIYCLSDYKIGRSDKIGRRHHPHRGFAKIGSGKGNFVTVVHPPHEMCGGGRWALYNASALGWAIGTHSGRDVIPSRGGSCYH